MTTEKTGEYKPELFSSTAAPELLVAVTYKKVPLFNAIVLDAVTPTSTKAAEPTAEPYAIASGGATPLLRSMIILLVLFELAGLDQTALHLTS